MSPKAEGYCPNQDGVEAGKKTESYAGIGECQDREAAYPGAK